MGGRRHWVRWTVAVVLVAAVAIAVSSCGSDSSTATWEIGQGQPMATTTTEFTAVVSRTGCSSGVQGTPETPTVEYSANRIVITFRIRPHIDGGTCQGTPGVPYLVRLSEPVGHRSLVDGGCHRGSTARATGFCDHEGVRRGPT